MDTLEFRVLALSLGCRQIFDILLVRRSLVPVITRFLGLMTGVCLRPRLLVKGRPNCVIR